QRLGDVRGDHGDGHVLHLAQALERAHDAPHGAEQAHVGADRADVGKEFQIALEQADLARTRHLHGALGTLDHAARIVRLALPLAGELAETRLEDVLDPPLLPPRLLTSRNNWARSPPDQKRSSNASASSSAALVWVYLRMMITHDRNEPTSNTASTSCTGRLESAISVKMFSPLFIACRFSAGSAWVGLGYGLRDQVGRNLRRAHARQVHASHPHAGADQATAVRFRDRLGEQDTG